MISIWKRLEEFPPILVRLMARKSQRKPLSTEEIARASGLTPCHVEMLSGATEWTGIDIPTAYAFLTGCRMDLTDARIWRIAHVYRDHPKCTFRYLRTHPRWPDYYEPLMEKYLNALRSR